MHSQNSRKWVSGALACLGFLILLMVPTVFHVQTVREYRASLNELREGNRLLEQKLSDAIAQLEKFQKISMEREQFFLGETEKLRTEISDRMDGHEKKLAKAIRASGDAIKKEIGSQRAELALLIKAANEKIAGTRGDLAYIKNSVQNVETAMTAVSTVSNNREEKIAKLLYQQVQSELSMYKGKNYNTVFNNILAGLMNKHMKRFEEALANLNAARDINSSITYWKWNFIIPLKEYDRGLDSYIQQMIDDVNKTNV